MANTNFSSYRDIYMCVYMWGNVPREFKENIETRIRWTGLEKALSFLFPRRFGITRDFSIRKPLDFSKTPMEIEHLLPFWIWFPATIFPLLGFYYFISIVLCHCDSNHRFFSFLPVDSNGFSCILEIFLFVISFLLRILFSWEINIKKKTRDNLTINKR